MTAAELIEKLSKLSPDTEILAPEVGCCGDGEWVESMLVRHADQVALISVADWSHGGGRV
jgi:hypothetical protein